MKLTYKKILSNTILFVVLLFLSILIISLSVVYTEASLEWREKSIGGPSSPRRIGSPIEEDCLKDQYKKSHLERLLAQ